MPIEGWLQVLATLLAILALSVPVGRYMARVVTDQPTWFDRLFDPIDDAIYFLIGRRVTAQAMNWRAYTIHMLAANLVMATIVYLVLSFQHRLPLNPLKFPGLEAFLAFNTAISFIINTNWQACGGEPRLPNFSQMGATTFPMFTSAATGFVVAMAFIPAFVVRDGGANLGNFYRDLIRFLTRVVIPVCLVVALFTIEQSAVQTLDASITIQTLQGQEQTVIVRPLASQGAIELVDANGGGFYSVNAAHPSQNPTPITNITLIALIALLPASRARACRRRQVAHACFWDPQSFGEWPPRRLP